MMGGAAGAGGSGTGSNANVFLPQNQQAADQSLQQLILPLLGLSANALFGWWWADPLAALLMVPWLVKEGVEGLRAEACGCAGPVRKV